MAKIISQPGNYELNEATFDTIFIIKPGIHNYPISKLSCLALAIALERNPEVNTH